MKSIFMREWKSHFISPVGFVFIALFLAAIGLLSRMVNLQDHYPTFEYVLMSGYGGLLYVIMIPVLTMRSFSEERKQKTDILLYTLPVSSADVVLGKFFACAAVLAVPTGVMCFYPLILSLYGSVNFAASYLAILTYYLLGLALCALCMFLGSLTESQVIAVVTGVIALFGIFALDSIADLIPSTVIASVIGYLALVALAGLLIQRLLSDLTVTLISCLFLTVVILGCYLWNSAWFEGSFASLLRSFALFSRFGKGVQSGYFDLTAVAEFLSVTAAFLFFSVRVMEKRRWN